MWYRPDTGDCTSTTTSSNNCDSTDSVLKKIVNMYINVANSIATGRIESEEEIIIPIVPRKRRMGKLKRDFEYPSIERKFKEVVQIKTVQYPRPRM